MSDSLGLHRVENSSHTEPAVSLHLYCPPFSSCSMFDQRTGHRTKCNVTFWSKYGERPQNVGKLSEFNDIHFCLYLNSFSLILFQAIPELCSVCEAEDN